MSDLAFAYYFFLVPLLIIVLLVILVCVKYYRKTSDKRLEDKAAFDAKNRTTPEYASSVRKGVRNLTILFGGTGLVVIGFAWMSGVTVLTILGFIVGGFLLLLTALIQFAKYWYFKLVRLGKIT